MGLGFVEGSSAQVKCLLFHEQALSEHTDPHCKHTDSTSHLTVFKRYTGISTCAKKEIPADKRLLKSEKLLQ